MEQLLATKLYIPQMRPQIVPRPRLVDPLCAGLHEKLTLISAPAGFGKTTLVAELLAQLNADPDCGQKPEFRVAWLSLDKDDNDRARFLTYLIASLRTLEDGLAKGLLSEVQSPQTPSNEAVLTALINEIAAIPDRILLIMDDYHLIETGSIHAAVDFLLDNLPPQVHLFIITREDPLLRLSRLRARGQLTELRAADLRFTPEEAADFLNRVMGLNLSSEEIAALEARTEGWIAGLQLAAISMQGSADARNFVKSFTGSNRYILDYLIEEVLDQCPQETQSFLLRTSLLDRLSGALCDTLTGQNDGQETLERLEHTNLFIVPLDQERHWYRYHHLFQDLLRTRLRQAHPERIAEIHEKASAWFERNGFAYEGLEHALLAGDYERSAALLADLADPLWERGEHDRLRDWLGKFPGEWLCAKTLLCIYHAWFLYSVGRQEQAEGYLQAAEDDLAAHGKRAEKNPGQKLDAPSAAELRKLRGRLSAVRALMASWGDDVPEIIQHASLAIENLPPGDPWRGMSAVTLGDAYVYSGDLRASYRSRLETQEASQPSGDRFLYMIANLKVATTLREMGMLDETIEICRQQLDYARQNDLTQTRFTGWALGLWGISLAEQNDLEKALELSARSVELTWGGDLGFVGFSQMTRAKTLFYRGEYLEAEATLKRLAEMAHRHFMPHYITGALAAWQARLSLAQGRLDEALRRVEESGLDFDGDLTLPYDDVRLVYTRILLAQGHFESAAELIERLLEPTLAAGFVARSIEIGILLALAYQGCGEQARAVEALGRALSLGEAGGFVRYFVDEGPATARLLYEALSEDIAPKYVRRLLAAFPDQQSARPAEPVQGQVSLPDWIEPLSERELEVLVLIAEGFTNPDIAARLYLSLNTVKVHTRNIYSKLGVNNRTSAVTRGRSLGILSPT